MATSLVWALLLLAGISHVSCLQDRIVGGQETTIQEYPSLVQVDIFGAFTQTWSQGCGANILTSRYCLGAAHCFYGILYEPSRRRIRAGSTYRNIGGVVAYVLKENNHPNYDPSNSEADLTVVELSSSLIYTPVVQRATIISQGTKIPYGVPVVHAGWGATYYEGPSSPVLRDVGLFTIDTKVCAEIYKSEPLYLSVTDNMICAGVPGIDGRDACTGDAGGPLYYGDILVGIISFGNGCGNGSFPRVSTSVASYTDWIVYVAEGN